MRRVGDLALRVRSKNAGPFWLTVDVFCGAGYEVLVSALEPAAVAARFGVGAETVKRVDVPALRVIKLSLPRPAIQGAVRDRDMHGAGFAAIIRDMSL